MDAEAAVEFTEYGVRFLVAADTAVVAEFGEKIERELSERVLRLSALIRASAVRGILETVPTYRSLLVHYDPLATDSASVITAIKNLLDEPDSGTTDARLWRIPACYAPSHAPDLVEVSQRTGICVDEIVRLHVNTCFHVYMIGFAPGFPYMGDLPAPLMLPRRHDPRVKVPAGSIAIAVGMTAVYPVESPGGWHLIGATPLRLFDVRRPRPALLRPGDKVRFEPITTEEFDSIRAAVTADAYEVPCESMAA